MLLLRGNIVAMLWEWFHYTITYCCFLEETLELRYGNDFITPSFHSNLDGKYSNVISLRLMTIRSSWCYVHMKGCSFGEWRLSLYIILPAYCFYDWTHDNILLHITICAKDIGLYLFLLKIKQMPCMVSLCSIRIWASQQNFPNGDLSLRILLSLKQTRKADDHLSWKEISHHKHYLC